MTNNPNNNPLKFDINTRNNHQALKRPNTFRHRYPGLFVSLVSISGLVVFFSKPLYDLFLNDQTFDIEQLKREHKSRFSR